MAAINIPDGIVSVFVDTAAWIALLNKNDELREQALAVFDRLSKQRAVFITTEFVLIEVADALSAPLIRQSTFTFINGLRENPIIRIVPLNHELLDAAWDFYGTRPDKEWGITDCTSFCLMQNEGIHYAFTSDHHFHQAGFYKLM